MILAFTWFAQKSVRERPQIFELVVGPGSNYAATVAPASQASAANPLVKSLDRAETRTEQRVLKQAAVEAANEQKLAAQAAAAAAKNALPDKTTPAPAKTRVTASTVSKTGPASPTKTSPLKYHQIDTQALVNGVNAPPSTNHGEGANGTALSRALADEAEAYLAMLRQRVREAFQAPDGVSDSLQAEVVFMLNTSGSVTGVRISTSSGNPAFDRAVLAAFRAMPSLPPPPSGHAGSYSLVFKVHDEA